jgi:hypothetical protein
VTDVPKRLLSQLAHVELVNGPWHRGRVLLVGDAAHRTTPLLAAGAAIGMETDSSWRRSSPPPTASTPL